MTKWDETRLQQYIADEVEESLTLDYKAAASLDKNDSKKREITKDVSAMANVAGGTIIYGIKEFPQPKNHLPEKLDPIDRSNFSKEWLEHVINNIRPRIDNVLVHPVSLSSGSVHVAYVVEIPKSDTAHQALDYRYYRRFNFEAVPMTDDEVRDVMRRAIVGPAIQGLIEELEFNAHVANSSGDLLGCHFHEEQFKRAIELGVLSSAGKSVKDAINRAYVAIGRANHVLETWTSSADTITRSHMAPQVRRTVTATKSVIETAITELKTIAN